MKQTNLFGTEFEVKEESEYTSAITLPLYEPKNKKPHILELADNKKTNRLIQEINASDLPEDEKKFLILAAQRHTVFNYEKIADYYSHATPEMQKFMERSALVVIDFNKAYAFGYINLAHDLANQYFDNYGE
jgi:hypothetical protein